MITISDHGMRLLPESRIGGWHSHHAYISFDRQVDVPEQLSILHIRGIIERFLNEEAPEL